jgi:hypothetical protein
MRENAAYGNLGHGPVITPFAWDTHGHGRTSACISCRLRCSIRRAQP